VRHERPLHYNHSKSRLNALTVQVKQALIPVRGFPTNPAVNNLHTRIPQCRISFLPHLPDDRAADPEVESGNKKNDGKTQGHHEPFKTAKVVSLATPIEEQRSECNRDSLKSHNDEVNRRTQDFNQS